MFHYNIPKLYTNAHTKFKLGLGVDDFFLQGRE
jgi:hypothetical protein